MTSSIKVGISSCLLGQQVRYDGGHKLSSLCVNELSRLFELVPSCPEAGAGLGVPRPAVRLVGNAAAPRARGVENAALDVTDALQDYAARRIPELTDLCGYIFIRNSPSCGLLRVPLFDANGTPTDETSRGIFAAAFTAAYPLLPVDEEARLHDAALRESFITRVLATFEWKQQQPSTRAALTGFHARYKYSVMAHSLNHYQQLGRMLAQSSGEDVAQLGARYFTGLMEGLSQPATRGSHTNVLMHLQGYLKTTLRDDGKRQLEDMIEAYRHGDVALVEPVRLLRHLFERYPNPYIARQAYLQSHCDDARGELVT